MKKTTMLRKLLKEQGLVFAPCAYDCLTARCVEAVGFKAVFMTGVGIRDAQFGMPDIGILTATEVINCIKYMANSVNIPLIVDADDGYGGALAAYRTTQEIIRAGAAGMFIDDQKHPTKSPSISFQEVLPRDEYLGKVGAVMEARDKEDKDFLIVARIDALATMGSEETVARAKACLKLGADMILPQCLGFPRASVESLKKTMQQLYKAIGAPEVPIWGTGGPTEFTAKDYEDIGAKFLAEGVVADATLKAALDFYQVYHDTGTVPNILIPQPSVARLRKLRGLNFWNELERRYVVTKNI